MSEQQNEIVELSLEELGRVGGGSNPDERRAGRGTRDTTGHPQGGAPGGGDWIHSDTL
jgi:hypothetical protein